MNALPSVIRDELLLHTLASGGKQLELSDRKCEMLDFLTVPAPGGGLLGSKLERRNRPLRVAAADVVRRPLRCDLSGSGAGALLQPLPALPLEAPPPR